MIDTLAVARRLHPGQRNSLDALCKRYGVDNSRRDLHGALLDARILVDVYLAMTGGQAALQLEATPTAAAVAATGQLPLERHGLPLPVVCASTEEQAAHERQLDIIAKACPDGALWRQLTSA